MIIFALARQSSTVGDTVRVRQMRTFEPFASNLTYDTFRPATVESYNVATDLLRIRVVLSEQFVKHVERNFK